MGFLDSLNPVSGIQTTGLSDLAQSISNATGLPNPFAKVINSKQPFPLPWETSNIDSKFFHSISIDPNRWDQLFPYRLVVIDSTDNTVVNSVNTVPDIKITNGTGISTVIFENVSFSWVLTLPITPQQLSITDQFAINTTATLRGVLEEHSGVRFKLINASGSMGVWAYRSSVTKPPQTPGLIQSLFGGTIAAANNVLSQASQVINAATSDHPANKPTPLRPEASDNGQTSTGYFFAIALQQFLEQYAEAKKDPNNASWRLVFDMPKQNQSFVVTPMQFVWSQNVNKAMEIQYAFQLKAWRRIDLKGNVVPIPANNQPISPGILQRALSTLSAARKTMGASRNLVNAVGGDVGVLKSLSHPFG